jgi:hypothetical protein
MITVAIRALELEYLVKVLDWGRSRSRYIYTDSDSTQNSFRLRLHPKFLPTPTPQPCFQGGARILFFKRAGRSPLVCVLFAVKVTCTNVLYAFIRWSRIRQRGTLLPVCITTLELVAQIHTDVSTAAWREWKQTLLYHVLLTKIFFSTGMLLFMYCDRIRDKRERGKKRDRK